MADDTYFITPHEAALAVVATSMKKARLRLDTLIINSIVGGVLFTAGGMLHLCFQSENPGLMETNPGVVHYVQGLVYCVGLFYVIVMGAELYNSNILYFSVGVCRGAVSVLDLLVSWSVSWLFNLGSTLFVCYVICDLSGVTRSEHYITGSIAIAEDKLKFSFIQTFIKGIAGNFCVCLAVYLQLLAKPLHVKLIVMCLPIFTFVTMGFTHTVADMFLVPMGMFNGANVGVGEWIWKGLIPATLGNALGGSVFGMVIPWYLHLVVVERDRRMLNLPEYEAKDEQPELEMDSRVIRVKSGVPLDSPEKSVGDESDSSDDIRSPTEFNPVSYRPSNASLSRQQTGLSRLSTTTSRESKRSPPGVFPVLGMGKPLTREATIAGQSADEDDIGDEVSINSYATSGRSYNDTASMRLRRTRTQKEEEDDYVSAGGYNPRENTIGETLKKVITRRGSTKSNVNNDVEMGPTFVPRRDSVSSKLLRTISAMTQKQPDTSEGINEQMTKHKITQRAASASDNIAGIDSYSNQDHVIAKPAPMRRQSSQFTTHTNALDNHDEEEENASKEQ